MSSLTEKKTLLAKRQIVRLIWDEHFSRGDQLPACAELCRRFGLGASTVFSAQKNLCEDGILKAKDKVGVFVRDPQTHGCFGYHVAILINGPDIPPFPMALTYYLQTVCLSQSCNATVFSGNFTEESSENEDVFNVMPGLKQQVKSKSFDGVITLVSLSQKNLNTFEQAGIPVCFVGGFLPSRCKFQTSLSIREIFRLGAKLMKKTGAKRPAFLWPSHEASDMEKIVETELGKKAKIMPGPNRHGVDQFVTDLLQMPPGKRPDALLIPDDLVAQMMYSQLIRRNGMDYLPHPVILSEKEIPVCMPVPADHLEYSVKELAGKAVDLLKRAMKAPSSNRRESIFITPILNGIQ